MPAPPLGGAVAAAAGWPWLDFMEACALPEAVSVFRSRARRVLRDWRLCELTEAAELVVSELVTNSVAATGALQPAYPVRMWLLSDGSRVLVVVADSSALMPVRAAPADEADSGRGLLLVETVSDCWGWYKCPGSGQAKAVWAELSASGL